MTIYKRVVFCLLFICLAFTNAKGQPCTLAVKVDATNNGVICSGAAVVLTATATGGTAPYAYTWSTGETTPVISVNKAGTYNVTVTDKTAGCQPVTESIVVSIGTLPDAPTVANAVVCNNNSATLKATAPGGLYQWYDAATGGNFLAGGDTYTTPPITTQTVYYVQTTIDGCTGPRTAVTVSLSGRPFTSGAQVCAGNAATLNAGGASAYTWYDAPGGNVVGTGPSFTTPPLTATRTYYVVALINECSSDAVPVTAAVTPFPQAPVATGVTVCTGSAATLHADGAGVLDWFSTPTGGSSLITSPDYTTPPLRTTTTYYVQSINNGCASQRTAVTVTVNPIPDVPVVAGATICAGTNASLTASSTAGGTYNWFADAAGTKLLYTGNPFNTPVLGGTATYYVQTLNGGCSSSLVPVTVTVNQKPVAPLAAATAVCPNTPATLTATAPGGDYAWYDDAAGGNLVGTGTAFTTPALAKTTTYYVQTTINGCTSDRTAVLVTVYTPPAAPTANNTSVCAGNVTTLIASGAENYQWYDAATGGSLLSAGKVFVTPALNANATYYVQTTVNGCVSARTPVTVTVNAIPPAPIGTGTNICPGGKAVLTASVPAGGSITWYDEGGTQVGAGPTFTTPVIFVTTNYYAQNRVGDCISSRTEVVASTVPVAYPQFEYTSGTYCTTAGNQKPVINDPAGGTFSVSSAGLVFVDTHTGEINIGASKVGKYTVTFVGNESCHSITQQTFSIVTVPNAAIAYGGPFCQYGSTNPGPIFTLKSTAGVITAAPAGLVFLDGTSGIIDLKKSKAGTYTVTNTIPLSGTCPETSASTTVVISPGADVNAGPDQLVNAGSPAQLKGIISGVSGGRWSGGTGTFSDPTNPNATYTAGPGETVATLTLTTDSPAGSCGAKSDQVQITFVSAPSAPIAAGASICSGQITTLSATAPGGNYAWFDAPTGGNTLATGPNFTTPALTATTTYYVQTTIQGNTSTRTAVSVTVNPIPAAPNAAPAQTCFNATATLTATGSTGNYEWYDAPVNGTKLGSGNTFTTAPLQINTSFYVQAIGSSCPSARTKVDVSLLPGIDVTSPKTASICSGTPQSYTITSSVSGINFTWERPAVAGISNAAVAPHSANTITEALINTGTSPVDVAYNITASAGGCVTPFQYIVTVYPASTVTSAAKAIICNGNPLNYDITFDHPPSGFSWSRAAVAGIDNAAVTGQAAGTIKEILRNSTNAPVDVTYVFNYSQGDCAGTFNFVATINPTVGITSPPTAAACNNVNFNYNITSNVTGTTFTWRRDAVPNISNPAATGTTAAINETLVNTATNPVNVVYIISPTFNGCRWPDFGLVVTVFPTPPVAVANSDSPVCTGTSLHLQTPTITGASYQWTGPNGFVSTKQNPEIDNVSQANAGVYSLSLIINGCAGPSATTAVKINQPGTADAGTDQTICILENTVKLNGKIGGGTTTGIWTTSGTGTFSPSNNQLDATYLPSAQDKANGVVVLTLSTTSKDNCTIVSDNVTITIAPTPAVGAGADREVCSQDNAIPLSGNSIKPGPVMWITGGSGSFSPSATDLHAVYVPSAADVLSGSVKLTLKYLNAGVCDIPSDDMTIKFIPPPTVDAGETRYVLKGNKITLYPKVSDANVTYQWTPNSGISNTNVKNPVITGGDKDVVYTLSVTDVRGCVSQSQVLVKVQPVININNTFTPNGDGVNDLWTITGLIAYINASVDVFDRSGSRVYHSLGYDHAWDGTYNGQPVPAATYYYVIRLNFNNQVLSGPITVIR